MTDKTDLLPMPEGKAVGMYRAWSYDQMRDYARANVLHHTATLQTEIEALRAEVSELRAARIAYASEFPEAKDGGPDTGNIHTNIRSLKARAERLAEALQRWWKAHRPVGWTEEQHRSCPHVNLATDAEKALATALLRDQEEGLNND